MASDLIERLTALATRLPTASAYVGHKGEFYTNNGAHLAREIRDAITEAATALITERERAEKAEKEVERCHARLETDHHFVMSGNDDDDLVRVEIPLEDRQHEIDGIECRDATIKMLDYEVSAMAASLAEAKRLLTSALRHAENEGDDTLVTVVRRFLAQEEGR